VRTSSGDGHVGRQVGHRVTAAEDGQPQDGVVDGKDVAQRGEQRHELVRDDVDPEERGDEGEDDVDLDQHLVRQRTGRENPHGVAQRQRADEAEHRRLTGPEPAERVIVRRREVFRCRIRCLRQNCPAKLPRRSEEGVRTEANEECHRERRVQDHDDAVEPDVPGRICASRRG